MPDRLNWASFQIGDQVVAVPWQTRDELLDRARPLEPLQSLCRRIEGAGATRPVLIDENELAPLIAVLQVWIDQTTVDNFDESLFALRDAIAAEVLRRDLI